MSTFSRIAVSRIFSVETITPRSTTSKLLHCITTPTIFLPISCTSPLTVAIKILPLAFAFSTPDKRFSSSINGIRCATACFITRADFTTCGKNILPAPNKSPTTFMPSISGPSITLIGRPPSAFTFKRHSSVSSTIYCVMPFTSAWVSRVPTGSLRQARSSTRSRFLPLNCSAKATRRSVESARRLKMTSSTSTSKSFGISSYTPSWPALTIPIVIPTLLA